MSALAYRSWDMFLNQRVAALKPLCHGHFEVDLVAFTMTEQTLEFLEQQFELRLPHLVKVNTPPSLRASSDSGAALSRNCASTAPFPQAYPPRLR